MVRSSLRAAKKKSKLKKSKNRRRWDEGLGESNPNNCNLKNETKFSLKKNLFELLQEASLLGSFSSPHPLSFFLSAEKENQSNI